MISDHIFNVRYIFFEIFVWDWSKADKHLYEFAISDDDSNGNVNSTHEKSMKMSEKKNATGYDDWIRT